MKHSAGLVGDLLLLLLCCASCGGNTVGSKPEPGEPEPVPHVYPVQPEPTQTTGGIGSNEQPPSQAGAPAAEPEFPCEGQPQPVCLQDCTSLDRYSADCVAGQYQCPAGWVDLDACSKEACARRARNCCAPTGQVDYPMCTADGNIGECPAGFKQVSPCVPEGLGVETCDEIQHESACTSTELTCYTGKCSRNCRCEVNLEGRLLWQCLTNAC